MRRFFGLALLSVLAAALPAQTDKPDAKAAYDALQAEFSAADKDFRAAMAKLTETDEWKAALEAKDRAKLDALRANVKPVDRVAFMKRAMELAGSYQGDGRVPFYNWVAMTSSDKDLAIQAVEALRKDHVASPALVELLERGMMVARVVGAEKGAEFLQAVIEQNPDSQAKAWAMYWTAMPKTRAKDATPEQREQAQQMLAEAAKLAAGTILADRIAAPEFEKNSLQIGKPVPDIEGEDIDGVKFKLSDYHGKVVVLDFWGFW
ncbi:MAG: hypothetical protein RIT25_2830 [Planctomycetota bacterium]|jgi:hypothetical protein